VSLPDPYAPPGVNPPPDPYAPPAVNLPPEYVQQPVVGVGEQPVVVPVQEPQVVVVQEPPVVGVQQPPVVVAEEPPAAPPAYGALAQPGDPSLPPPAPVLEPAPPQSDQAPPVNPNLNRNGWATLALVAAAISFSLPAIALGVLGLRRAAQLNGRGRRRSIAAIIIGAIWLVLGIVALVLGHGDVTGLLGMSGGSANHAVSAGQCIEVENPGAADTEFTVTTCTEPHDAEVFGVATVRDANGNTTWSFPGDEAVQTQAENFCVTEFARYVGTTPEASELNMHVIAPNAETWGNSARSIICYVTTMDGSQLEAGTIRNSGR